MTKRKEIIILYVLFPLVIGIVLDSFIGIVATTRIYLFNEKLFEYQNSQDIERFEISFNEVERIIRKPLPLDQSDAVKLNREIEFVELLAIQRYIRAIRYASNLNCRGSAYAERLTSTRGRTFALIGSEMGDMRSKVNLFNCL